MKYYISWLAFVILTLAPHFAEGQTTSGSTWYIRWLGTPPANQAVHSYSDLATSGCQWSVVPLNGQQGLDLTSSFGDVLGAWITQAFPSSASTQTGVLNATPYITNLTTAPVLTVGESVTGPGIPSGATIVALGSGSFTLSAAATTTDTEIVTLGTGDQAVVTLAGTTCIGPQTAPGLYPGEPVYGFGIPSGATVTAVSNGSVTLSSPVTATVSEALTFGGEGGTVQTGTLNGTTSITGLSNTVGLFTGESVSGVGLPAGTTIVTITNSTSVVLSAPALVTETVVFGDDAYYGEAWSSGSQLFLGETSTYGMSVGDQVSVSDPYGDIFITTIASIDGNYSFTLAGSVPFGGDQLYVSDEQACSQTVTLNGTSTISGPSLVPLLFVGEGVAGAGIPGSAVIGSIPDEVSVSLSMSDGAPVSATGTEPVTFEGDTTPLSWLAGVVPDGSTTDLAYYAYRYPLAAFGSGIGGTPQYTGQWYSYAVNLGMQDSFTDNSNNFIIKVWDKMAGAWVTNLTVQDASTGTSTSGQASANINLPHVPAASATPSATTAWDTFASDGYQKLVSISVGSGSGMEKILDTTLQYVPGDEAWQQLGMPPTFFSNVMSYPLYVSHCCYDSRYAIVVYGEGDFTGGPATQVISSGVSGSYTMTLSGGNTASVSVGNVVTGSPGSTIISPGTYVTNISGNTVTLSNPLNASLNNQLLNFAPSYTLPISMLTNQNGGLQPGDDTPGAIYAIDFDPAPAGWQSSLLELPQFNGTPAPPLYEGMTSEQLQQAVQQMVYQYFTEFNPIVWTQFAAGGASDGTGAGGTGTDFKKTTTTSAWDAHAVGQNVLYGDGVVQCQFTGTCNALIGLDVYGGEGGETQLAYALYSQGSTVYTWTNGANGTSQAGAVPALPSWPRTSSAWSA